MPDLPQQEAGERVFTEVGALKVLQAETVTKLDALMPSILDKAFRDELLAREEMARATKV